MISDTEPGMRLALEADLALEKQRDEQIDAKDAEIAKEEAEGERIAAELTLTHQQVVSLTADHEALKWRLYDGLIDGTETDPEDAATAIQASTALRDLHIGKLRHITENRLPAQRLRILTPKKERAVLHLDRAGIRGRVHASQLLLAVIPAGAIGGDLSIRSEMGARLAHEESQAAYDLEAASNALEAELATQRKIRDARSNGGPVSFVNPS